MQPTTMKRKAQDTKNNRQNMEDINSYSLKVFGDVFEAMVAAIFLDTEGSLKKTYKIIIKNLLKPYLFVYGNTETM